MFGGILRAHRLRLGLTQEAVAEQAGLSVRNIRDLERGRIIRPRLSTVRRLADAFGLSGVDRDQFHESAWAVTGLPSEVGTPSPDDRASGPPAIPAQLPARPSDFVGQRSALRILNNLLPQEGHGASGGVALLAGAAGVGKTALALHWAHRVADHFPDGHLYADLRAFHPVESAATASEVLWSFLLALGVPPACIPASADARAAHYRSLLSARRMLVVLDDAADAQQVRPLLPGGARCAAVVTSRRQLTGLTAAQGARLATVDPLSADEARQLLAGRLGEQRIAAEPAAVDRIVARCGRLPLALALVAARATAHPTFALTALADELDATGNPLDALHSNDPATDVSAVFDQSYQALSADSAKLFVTLGAARKAQITAGEATGLSGLPLPRVASLLRELALANLLSEPAPGHFVLPDLLRAYAIGLTADRRPAPSPLERRTRRPSVARSSGSPTASRT